jgi:GAF domain-containing protein
VSFSDSSDVILRLKASEDGIHLPDMRESEEPGVESLYWAGLNSIVAVPLKAANQMLGPSMVARIEVDAFGREEFEFLKTFGEHVSLAAHQSRLYE